MGWFDEQIRERKRKDEEDIVDTLREIAGTVTGRHETQDGSRKDRTGISIAQSMNAILTYYHIKAEATTEKTDDLNELLESFCQPHGIYYRPVKLGKGWYRNAAGAMLGTKKDGSYVALLPNRLFGYSMYDGNANKKIKVNARIQDVLEAEAVCFYRPFPQQKLTIMSLLKYITQCVPVFSYVMVILAIFVATLVGMMTPEITHIIFSDVVTSGSLRLLLAVTVLSVCTSVSILLIQGISSLLTTRVNMQIDMAVQSASMARILSLPADFFKQYSSGELANRVQNVNSLCTMMTSTVIVTGLTSIFSLVYITQIFSYAPQLVIPALCIMAVTLVFTLVSAIWQMKRSRVEMQAVAKKSGMMYSLITGIQKIKLSGSEKRAFTQWIRLYHEEIKNTYGKPLFLTLNSVIATGISLTGSLVMYYFALQSNLSVADYYAFTAAYGLFSGAFMSVLDIAVTIAKIRPIYEMAKPIMDTVPETSENRKRVTRLTGTIELNNVSFRYDENMPLVIDNLSLKIKSGQYVAIVGRTGCGKSTLIRLLLGFETPQKGAIYYDGRDLSSLDLKSLRRNIGAVMQNGKLFQGDIYSNIVISAPWLSVNEAWEAAEIAGIAEDIRSMPMGMNTVISEGTGGISGGQKQRLMIARAVAPKPKILMFDEATSALDNITQKQVSDALGRLKCTRIVIAHRLSTIKQCDRILVLDEGKIVEDGTYDELLEEGGFFAELVERQRVG